MDVAKESWSSFLGNIKFDYALTLNFNREIKLISARKTIKTFIQRIDRKILGPRFFKKDSSERTLLIAVPEHINSNLHFHCLVLLPQTCSKMIPSRLSNSQLIENIWRDCVPSGRADVTIQYDRHGWAGYMTKSIYTNEVYENIIISTEFHK